MSVWYHPEKDELGLWYEEYWAGFFGSNKPSPWFETKDGVFLCLKHGLPLAGWILIENLS